MTTTDEKKPPVGGGQVDYKALGAVHTVVQALLIARSALQDAERRAGSRFYHPAAQAIREFTDTELDRLFAKVLPLLERGEEPSAHELALRAQRSGRLP